jgi:serine/threonine-protein kinase
VYRAYDKELAMSVAIKFLLSRYTNDFTAIESLKREAKAAMNLSHPNIVRLYNFEDTPQLKYILMEYVEGESLRTAASKRKTHRFTEPEVIRFMGDVCDALAYAHRERIVHRDIKPSNILLTADGRLKLTDFGIALNEKISSDSDDLAGTPSYMSPEQILGKPLDGRTDIYSLGVTMYEMLAGHAPFRGRDTSFQYVSVIPGPIEGVSDWLNGIILRCLRKEPDGRWINAEELRDVLSGKKEGGLALKAKFQPWWVVAEELRKSEPPKSKPPAPPPPQPKAEVKPPEYLRAEVQRTPLPPSTVRVQDRVEKLGKHAGLVEYASEHEQARLAYCTFAGILAGLALFAIEGLSDKLLSQRVLLQLNLMICGASYGIAVGLAHRQVKRGVLSFSFGAFGGFLAGLFVKNDPGAAIPYASQLPANMVLCGSLLGALLGIAEGVYLSSTQYLARCAFWGALGGAAGIAVFLLIRYLFSAFWSPLPNWIILDAAIGFFAIMAIALAKKPGIDETEKRTRK